MAQAMLSNAGANNMTLDLGNQSVVTLSPSGSWSSKPTSDVCGSTQNGSTDYYTTTTSSNLFAQFKGKAWNSLTDSADNIPTLQVQLCTYQESEPTQAVLWLSKLIIRVPKTCNFNLKI